MIPAKLLAFLPVLAYISFPYTAPDISAVEPSYRCVLNCSFSSAASNSVLESEDVDVAPCFPGGDFERVNFINTTRRYPVEDYNNKVQGRVVCRFIVNADGSISDASIVRGVSPTLNEEALRIINAMPNWIAGKINGENVPVYQVMSISFRL